MVKKKVLIVIGDVAGGHRSASNAIEKIFKDLYKDTYEVKTIDLFKLADVAPFNTSAESYQLVSKNPTLEAIQNFFFRVLNTEIGYAFWQLYVNSRLFNKTKEIIEKEKPDLVISIHPITGIPLDELKSRENNFKYATVITDLVTLNRGWADNHADLIFSPTEKAVDRLIKFGVHYTDIKYPLFPIKPSIQNYRPKDKVIKELGFDKNKSVITITGGGFGISSMLENIRRLGDRKDLQMIIITGKMRDFKNQLEEEFGDNPRMKILGWVDNIQDYLNVADIVVAKPGPATILEIELMNKKCILTRKIGEQEKGNIEYALENPKFRYIGKDWNRLEPAIDSLLRLDMSELDWTPRRSFDECEKIVKDLVMLLNC